MANVMKKRDKVSGNKWLVTADANYTFMAYQPGGDTCQAFLLPDSLSFLFPEQKNKKKETQHKSAEENGKVSWSLRVDIYHGTVNHKVEFSCVGVNASLRRNIGKTIIFHDSPPLNVPFLGLSSSPACFFVEISCHSFLSISFLFVLNLLFLINWEL